MYVHPLFLTWHWSTDCRPSATGDGGIPFNTQFFHDDFDDGPGFDDIYDGDGDLISQAPNAEPGERDLLSETQGQSRRIRPEAVNYAKRAKRVDVRKLKENIWKGLDIVVPPSQGQNDEEEDTIMVKLSILRIFHIQSPCHQF